MKILTPILLLASCLLAGCLMTGCVSGDLAALQAKLPANSFDKITIKVGVGPFLHEATFVGGVKQLSGALAIKSVEGDTTFMGWGSHLEISNLEISPPLTPTPAGLPVAPSPVVPLVAIKPTP